MVKRTVIITAGGMGTRIGASLPKQFLLLKGQPILMHTLSVFYSFDSEMQIIITLPIDCMDYWKSLLAEYKCELPHELVAGGDTRFASIQNALMHVKGEEVGVHDGVRPFVSHDTISRCFNALVNSEAVVPCLPVKDSIRKMITNASIAIDRSDLRVVHTPQCFNTAVLKSAYNTSFSSLFTDDASVVEANGGSVLIVDSNEENIKITSSIDLEIAVLLIEKK
jgi:2-C-methyl-D-erythritol 4-phosphate cytidylyltransferase